MTGPLPTRRIREARVHVREALARIADRVEAVRGAAPGERRGAMRAIVEELEARLRPHLRWEEETVHPLVDRFACEGPAAFSGSMRYEHEIIDRWAAELARRAEGDDAVGFARRADNLLGVVLAHFELEEHVLLPVLDRVLGPGGGGPELRPPAG